MRIGYGSVLVAALVLSGCAEKDSIFHSRAVKPGDLPHVVTVDAKQRHVLFNPQVLIDKETGKAASDGQQPRPGDAGDGQAPATSNGDAVPPSYEDDPIADAADAGIPPGTARVLAPGNADDLAQSSTTRNTGSQEKYKKDVNWRICAEAAPDVFSAFATSVSAKASADKQSFSAAFGLSSAETAATISRTQAINIIRESMYRTCERYLNGAINRRTLVTQAARDQRSMIAFLAIEQLTGAIRSPVTIISGPGTSSALGAGADAIKLVADFRKSAVDAKSAHDLAKADFDKANKGVNCDTKDRPTASSPATDAETAAQTAYDTCTAAKITLAAKSEADDKAQTQLDQALKVAAGAGALAEAATEAVKNQIGGGTSGGNAGAVADAVVKIVTASGLNESLMFCIGYLSDNDVARDQRDVYITRRCIGIIQQSAISDAVASNALSGDSVSIAAGLVQAGAYSEFQKNLLARIQSTKEANIAARMAAFETTAKVAIKSGCKTKAKCMALVLADRFRADYQADAAAAEGAIKTWDSN